MIKVRLEMHGGELTGEITLPEWFPGEAVLREGRRELLSGHNRF